MGEIEGGLTRFELRVSASALSLIDFWVWKGIGFMSTIFALVSDALISDLVNAIVAFILAWFGAGA